MTDNIKNEAISNNKTESFEEIKSTEKSILDEEKAALLAQKVNIIRQVPPCWNIGYVSNKVLARGVLVSFVVDRNNKPIKETIKNMIRYPSDEEKIAFESYRRAIIRCGTKGFDGIIHEAPIEIKLEVKITNGKMTTKIFD